MADKITRVHFDGDVLRPLEPLDLPAGADYEIRIVNEMDGATSPDRASDDAWDFLEGRAGTVEAPPDWSAEHDHYLYGLAKRSGRTEE